MPLPFLLAAVPLIASTIGGAAAAAGTVAATVGSAAAATAAGAVTAGTAALATAGTVAATVGSAAGAAATSAIAAGSAALSTAGTVAATVGSAAGAAATSAITAGTTALTTAGTVATSVINSGSATIGALASTKVVGDVTVGAVAAGAALAGATTAGAVGVASGIEAIQNENKAKEINLKAKKIMKRAMNSLNAQRLETNSILEQYGNLKLMVIKTSMNEFVELFKKIQSINFTEEIWKDKISSQEIVKQDLIELNTMTKNLAKTALTGAAGGTLLGLAAYGAVSSLGIAGTGTAIASLSGAAASNATLAWLGGGTLAVGGGGVALGTMVLGGLIAGPALLIGGKLWASEAKKQLNIAETNLDMAEVYAEKMSYAETKLMQIAKRTQILHNAVYKGNMLFRKSILTLNEIIIKEGKDYSKYSRESKKAVAAALTMARSMKVLLNVPILDNKGNLVGYKNNEIENLIRTFS